MSKKKLCRKWDTFRRLLCLLCILSAGTLAAFGQKRVNGTVTDTKGETVIGANVVEKGTTNGSITDVDGKFALTVGENAVLQVSFVGYVTQEITVGNRTELYITLQEDAQALTEVVVVGYGTQKKASLTGAVAAISGDQLQNFPTSNLTNALAGKLGGVTVAQNSGGRPGNTSELTIRARGTWNSTVPLYVIDGAVRDSRAFDMLDASEVENISVLKDASAASIYGSRAANGVVLVQTKRGKEGKPVVSYNGSVGVSNFTVKPRLETAAEHIAFTNDYEREYNVNPNTDDNIPYSEKWGFHYWPTTKKADGSYINTAVFTDDEIDYYMDPAHQHNLLDEALVTPVQTNHSVNISGGNEKVTYFAGATYYNESGAFKSLNYDKYTVRGSIDAMIAKGLKLSGSINTDRSTDKGPSIGSIYGQDASVSDPNDRRLAGMFYSLVNSSPLFPGTVDGKYIGTGSNMTGTNALALANGEGTQKREQYWNTEYTVALQYDIPWVKGLNAKVLYNNYTRQKLVKTYNEPYLVYQLRKEGTNNHILTDEIISSVEVGGKPSLSETHELRSNYQLNGFINYANTFGKHDVSAMIGFEQAEGSGENFSASKSDYDIAGHPYFNFGPTDKNFFGISGSGWEDARLSYIGRLNYGFDSRYLLEFSFRRDASVKFDSKHRWGFFPAGSAAWRISEEKFIRDSSLGDIISNLKLRGSIGLTGNDEVGSWQYMDLANVGIGGEYYGGTSSAYGVGIGRVANPLITWEKSLSYDGGLDAGFLNNMFTFSFDYYFRHTYDILGSRTNDIPDTFGASLADSNYGKVDSWGCDIELGFNKDINRDLTLYAKGSFGYSANKLIEYAETGVAAHLSKIGLNWDRQAGFITDGIVRTMTNNGDGTYTVNGKYVVPAEGYYVNRGSNYNITSSNKYAMRPGSSFILDLGSVVGEDAEGNKIYSDTPDGAITSDDADKRWIIDHYNPPYSFGLLLGGKWKGFSLEMFVNGLLGHQTFISTSNAAGYYWYEGNWKFWSEDHFSFEGNPDGKMPAPTNMGGLNMQGSGLLTMTTNLSTWVRDASFIRLKNVTLGYDINKNLLSKANISLAKIYVTCNNVALLYNPLKIYDPELAQTDNNPNPTSTKPGSGLFAFPLMRTLTFGVNFNF